MMNSDEQKYQVLMGKYKDLKGSQGPAANKYLKAAMAIRVKGNVREDIVIACSYL